METEHAPAFALIAFSDGKPASTPDQVRGRLFPENALPRPWLLRRRAFAASAGVD
jgi:hypothetical protein